MSRFAEKTTVPSDRSRAEIEKTLMRYGADSFMYGTSSTRAIIAFEAYGRRVQFRLPMPDRDADEFKRTPARRNVRTPEQREAAYEQAVRQRWRALALVIKAKLEAVEAGITEFEDEFLAHIRPTGVPGLTYAAWRADGWRLAEAADRQGLRDRQDAAAAAGAARGEIE